MFHYKDFMNKTPGLGCTNLF